MDSAKSDNFWHYNNKLLDFARSNRKSMTKAEACLWKFVLSKGQIQGYKFQRQRPILNYIADFICKELMLIIEVDGITHQWDEVAEKDKIREDALIKIGFTIIRFDDDDVLNHINHVIYQITEYVEEFKRANLPL